MVNKSLELLNAGDFTLSIILSAMAVECGLARVFVKWKEIDLGLQSEVIQKGRISWEVQLRKWTSIALRFDKVCEFQTTRDLDAFIFNHSTLLRSVLQRHPESTRCPSLKEFFEEDLFWKRKAIVHLGKIDSTRPDAEGSRRTAETLFQIISEMDFVRRQRMDATL